MDELFSPCWSVAEALLHLIPMTDPPFFAIRPREAWSQGVRIPSGLSAQKCKTIAELARRSKTISKRRLLEEVLSRIPSYSQELGLDLRAKPDRFKWFIASMLYAKRISSKIASETFRRFLAEGLTDPHSIARAGWDRIVEVLDSGGYVRYDFSTATNILESVRPLLEKYGGDVDQIHESASSSKDLEERLRGGSSREA